MALMKKKGYKDKKGEKGRGGEEGGDEFVRFFSLLLMYIV